ncbi:NUDIX domain-containing protein [Streptomyces sp. 130]|uniref:NUDIX domain-containing protein n=1 Tax=Streptomyces sp. 130 TaxID=2591006 RepID=UPI00117FB4EF|nr:NUDIX domain-containing protein [Streptomyces sp. 130]TRV80935.1 NUDIX domain-containing protein [Streptomyces sp. 130]
MPPSRSDIRDTIQTYLSRHAGERPSLEGLLAVLDSTEEPTSRATLPGHLTCSAVVIDRDRRVLHIGHRATGLLLCPGGHIEAGDRALLAAAVREVCEEAGLHPGDLCLTPQFVDEPIDVDVHDIDPDPAKGEPAHQHFDVRFAFYLTTGQPPALTLQDEEVAGAQWLPYADVRSPTLRAKLLAAEADGLDGRPEPLNASAIIHDGHGRYLLHLRDANKPWIWEPGCWSLLGGGRERQDRTLLDTVRRELREEAELTVAGLEPYAIEWVTGMHGTPVPVQVFTGRWNGEPARLPLTEGVMVAWVRPEKFPYMTMTSSTRKLLQRHAAEHPPAAVVPPAGAAGAARAGAPPGTVLNVVGVHLYLERDGQVLLGLRHPDSAFAGSIWHLLAGHCEAESATACLVREAYEEAGLVIDPADVELVHTVHMVNRPGAQPRIGLFFRARNWEGTPELREPDKCMAWQWWSAKDLPEPIVPYARTAIEGITAGRAYSELGWER